MQAWLMCFLLYIIPIGLAILEPICYYILPYGGYLAYAIRVAYFCFWIFGLIFMSNFRYGIRARYNIPPDSCCDCGIMTFCLPCAITQMYKHVYEHKSDCGICSDPGPHPPIPGGEQTTVTTTMVKTDAAPMVVAQPAAVVAVAQPAQPVVVAAQPVAVAAQPMVAVAGPPTTQVVVTTTAQPML